MGITFPPLGSVYKLDKDSRSLFDAHVLPVLDEYAQRLAAAGCKTEIKDGLDAPGPGIGESLVVTFGFGKDDTNANRLLVCLDRNRNVFHVYIASGEQSPRKRGGFDNLTAPNFAEMVKGAVESAGIDASSKST